MCSLYFLGVIAAFFGIGFFGISSVETASEAMPPVAVQQGASVTTSGDLEIMLAFSGEYAINVLRQVYSPEREMMEAQLFGTLLERNNCLYVEPESGEDDYLIVWAPGYVVSFGQGGAIIVFDEYGEAVRVGQSVYISGGQISGDALVAFEAESDIIPILDCPGPYWLMGDTAQPNE